MTFQLSKSNAIQGLLITSCIINSTSWEAPPCIDLPAKIPVYQKSPTFWAPGTSFVEDNFSMDWVWRGWFGDDSSIYCTLYFYYYYISSTSDHQALDPESWGPLLCTMPPFYSVTLFPFIRNHKPPKTSLQGYGQWAVIKERIWGSSLVASWLGFWASLPWPRLNPWWGQVPASCAVRPKNPTNLGFFRWAYACHFSSDPTTSCWLLPSLVTHFYYLLGPWRPLRFSNPALCLCTPQKAET